MHGKNIIIRIGINKLSVGLDSNDLVKIGYNSDRKLEFILEKQKLDLNIVPSTIQSE